KRGCRTDANFRRRGARSPQCVERLARAGCPHPEPFPFREGERWLSEARRGRSLPERRQLMRMLVLSIAAVFILAAPASAQHLGGIVGSPNEEGGSRRIVPVTPGVGPQLRQIDDDIDDGRDSGQLTKR